MLPTNKSGFSFWSLIYVVCCQIRRCLGTLAWTEVLAAQMGYWAGMLLDSLAGVLDGLCRCPVHGFDCYVAVYFDSLVMVVLLGVSFGRSWRWVVFLGIIAMWELSSCGIAANGCGSSRCTRLGQCESACFMHLWYIILAVLAILYVKALTHSSLGYVLQFHLTSFRLALIMGV